MGFPCPQKGRATLFTTDTSGLVSRREDRGRPICPLRLFLRVECACAGCCLPGMSLCGSAVVRLLARQTSRGGLGRLPLQNCLVLTDT